MLLLLKRRFDSSTFTKKAWVAFWWEFLYIFHPILFFTWPHTLQRLFRGAVCTFCIFCGEVMGILNPPVPHIWNIKTELIKDANLCHYVDVFSLLARVSRLNIKLWLILSQALAFDLKDSARKCCTRHLVWLQNKSQILLRIMAFGLLLTSTNSHSLVSTKTTWLGLEKVIPPVRITTLSLVM